VDSITNLLRQYNLHPRKSLGQNFLVDPVHLAKIVDLAELTLQDTVVEIGPGPGTLTHRLVQAAGRVIAVELDGDMVHLLRSELGHHPNLTVIEADILQTNLNALVSPTRPTFNLQPISYKVVANLPYYITSAVLRHLLESTPRPSRIVVTVQKEVARRIVAGPGAMSLLAVSVQFYGQPRLAHHIPAGAFFPTPKVDSAVVQIDTYQQPPVAVTDTAHFFQIVRAGFGQKRKQLKNSLAAGLHKPILQVSAALEQANIAPTRRAETLSMVEWANLAEVL
jgi:16S rRNA (adenine1518-N6/adenine1519-N6)-dimethyltransferase